MVLSCYAASPGAAVAAAAGRAATPNAVASAGTGAGPLTAPAAAAAGGTPAAGRGAAAAAAAAAPAGHAPHRGPGVQRRSCLLRPSRILRADAVAPIPCQVRPAPFVPAAIHADEA